MVDSALIEPGPLNAEVGIRNSEFGKRNGEVGIGQMTDNEGQKRRQSNSLLVNWLERIEGVKVE